MAWSLALGPGRPRPAGMLALSGFAPTVPGFALDWSRAAGLPVAIAHGTLDPVIGIAFGRAAREAAQAAGADVLYRETPVPHTIDPRVVPELVAWVRDRAP
jgi:phospholipase/carboxylesterase